MGADAIIVSKNKKLWCGIDRMSNFQDNRKFSKSTANDLEGDGCSPEVGIEIGEANLMLPKQRRMNHYQINKGIQFLKTLDSDDVVRLVDDSGDEHMEIIFGPRWRDVDDKIIENDDYSNSEYKEWDF